MLYQLHIRIATESTTKLVPLGETKVLSLWVITVATELIRIVLPCMSREMRQKAGDKQLPLGQMSSAPGRIPEARWEFHIRRGPLRGKLLKGY
jgi:hypothetical protein